MRLGKQSIFISLFAVASIIGAHVHNTHFVVSWISRSVSYSRRSIATTPPVELMCFVSLYRFRVCTSYSSHALNWSVSTMHSVAYVCSLCSMRRRKKLSAWLFRLVLLKQTPKIFDSSFLLLSVVGFIHNTKSRHSSFNAFLQSRLLWFPSKYILEWNGIFSPFHFYSTRKVIKISSASFTCSEFCIQVFDGSKIIKSISSWLRTLQPSYYLTGKI